MALPKKSSKAAVSKKPGQPKPVKKLTTKSAVSKGATAKAAHTKASPTKPAERNEMTVGAPVEELLLDTLRSKVGPNPKPIKMPELEKRLVEFNVKSKIDMKKILTSVNKIDPQATIPVSKMPEDIKKSIQSLKPQTKRFHGAKISLAWFPFLWVKSPCADKFGYMSPSATRAATKMPFNVANQVLLRELGDMMGDPGREASPDSNIPAGFTYVGQFVDHDITLDVSSSIEVATDANTINNMRSPAMDLDSVYGAGPALDPFMYVFPNTGPATAIKFNLGTNRNDNNTIPAGGPGGSGGFGGMQVQTDFDVPRVHNPLNPALSSNTAIIGDPRNDENLIVTQFHMTMLKFHNAVVDLLLLASFSGDIFVEAKKIVTHHYQWAVMHDFMNRICGTSVVNNSFSTVSASVGSAFRMPVEFAVAAYRFGHSMIRNNYWVNFNFINASLGQVFQFNRNPNLPVLANWVVDFNAFFDTGVSVPVNNKARKIDSVLANGLEFIPEQSGIMAILATRNLRRGLALGLPSGQGMAAHFGVPPLTTAELIQGLPQNEIDVLNKNGGILLQKTPLWYYILRESAVKASGNTLGPVGARIVADTFVRILKRDANSYWNVPGGFTPMLPSVTAGNFTFADLVIFAGVTQP